VSQQIAGWLAREFGDDESMRVSHETIYRSLFIQARGVLKKQLTAHLGRGRMLRRGRHYANTGPGRGEIRDMVSIRDRPAQAEDRAVPGHWEEICWQGQTGLSLRPWSSGNPASSCW
jgi:IS30 family transposase